MPRDSGHGKKFMKVADGGRQLSSINWNNALGNAFSSGHLADVHFFVGPTGERREIRAHRLVLSSRSTVFCAMMEERWNSKTDENFVRIEIGIDIIPLLFEKMIKFVYDQNLEECLESLELKDLFELRAMGDMYELVTLKEGISYKIAVELVEDYTKCFWILGNELLDENLRAVAFAVIKRNLNEALTGDESLSHWTKDLWENVLQDETFFAFMDESDSLNSVDEISLFKHLVRWRDLNPSSNEESFQHLLKLVRFSTMREVELIDDVRPTGVLTDTELLDILTTKLGTKPLPTQSSRIQVKSARRLKTSEYATTFEEVERFCNAHYGQGNDDFPLQIFLLPGLYTGVIGIKLDYLTLTGFGPYTVIQGRQSAIKIFSTHVQLENLTIRSQMFALEVSGNNNLIQNLRTDCQNVMLGIDLCGADNCLEAFSSISHISKSELEFKLELEEFTAFHQMDVQPSVPRFVMLSGLRSKVVGSNCSILLYKPNSTMVPRLCLTKFIVNHNSNEVNNVNFDEALNCKSDSSVPPLPQSGAWLYVQTQTAIVTQCCFVEMKVERMFNKFESVFVPGLTSIDGSDHEFTNCKFGHVTDESEDTVMTECITIPEWYKLVS